MEDFSVVEGEQCPECVAGVLCSSGMEGKVVEIKEDQESAKGELLLLREWQASLCYSYLLVVRMNFPSLLSGFVSAPVCLAEETFAGG